MLMKLKEGEERVIYGGGGGAPPIDEPLDISFELKKPENILNFTPFFP